MVAGDCIFRQLLLVLLSLTLSHTGSCELQASDDTSSGIRSRVAGPVERGVRVSEHDEPRLQMARIQCMLLFGALSVRVERIRNRSVLSPHLVTSRAECSVCVVKVHVAASPDSDTGTAVANIRNSSNRCDNIRSLYSSNNFNV